MRHPFPHIAPEFLIPPLDFYEYVRSRCVHTHKYSSPSECRSPTRLTKKEKEKKPALLAVCITLSRGSFFWLMKARDRLWTAG